MYNLINGNLCILTDNLTPMVNHPTLRSGYYVTDNYRLELTPTNFPSSLNYKIMAAFVINSINTNRF